MVVLGGVAVSYERGTPVLSRPSIQETGSRGAGEASRSFEKYEALGQLGQDEPASG